jgi:hypothetical protein
MLFNLVMAARFMEQSSGFWHWGDFAAACTWTWLLWSVIQQDASDKNDDNNDDGGIS